ncbi:MAG: hypothetical protein GX894_08195 [Clostridia bacterium]|nr:hypothetical protein [Clostridia bacterium]
MSGLDGQARAKIAEDLGVSPELVRQMEEAGIDLVRTTEILVKYNRGDYDHTEPVFVRDLPEVDGKRVLDLTGAITIRLGLAEAKRNIDRLGLDTNITGIGRVEGDEIVFDRPALARLGVELYPVTAYGVLNGGSASSYADHKRNQDFNGDLFAIYEPEFKVMAEICKGKAKGITPAFLNPNGQPGPSFMELKMRALLLEALRYQRLTGRKTTAFPLLFQMTSVYNNAQIQQALQSYKESPVLKELIAATGVDVTEAKTGIQPMLAAFSPGPEKPKTLFTRAFGRENNFLPMPGGHGQNFAVLRDVYRELLAKGIKYVSLGNVDNLGYTLDPVPLAITALLNRPGGFEFCFKTAVDIKGGILVIDQNNRLNCADIGPAISKEEVLRAEKTGKKILFNCAIGLFSLDYLVNNLDRIIDQLPVRFSEQNKDAGSYSQAEQITWEIIALMDAPLIFGVDKYHRFLAAKLLVESLMTSGLGLDDPRFPAAADPEKNLKAVAVKLHEGLTRKLETVYGMKLDGDIWRPKTLGELEKTQW